MFDNPFREEAISSRSERQKLDHLLRVTAPREHIILVATCIFFVAFIVWLLWGSVPRTLAFEGVVLETGDRHEVATNESGILIEIKVSEGDYVVAGEVIGRQTVPDLEKELSVLRSRKELLNIQIGEFADTNSNARSLLNSTETALLQMEERRRVRSEIVSHVNGVVTALYSSTGDHLPVGNVVAEVRENAFRQLQPVALVPRTRTDEIEPGMLAKVEITMPDGTVQFLEGEVVFLNNETLSNGGGTVMKHPFDQGIQLAVKLNLARESLVTEGTACRIRIQLKRTAPIDVLNIKRS